MCQILIGSLGYILLLNILESQHHTFTSHLRCKSQHETGRICLFILVAESASEVAKPARVVGATFARILMEDATNFTLGLTGRCDCSVPLLATPALC